MPKGIDSDKYQNRMESEKEKIQRIKSGEVQEEPDRPDASNFRDIDPMLASSRDTSGTIRDSRHYAEIKFDGTRLLVQKGTKHARAFTRRNTDRTDDLPSLMREMEEVLPPNTVIDGEFVFFDEDGVSQFKPLHTGKEKIREENLEPGFMVFDILYHDGEKMMEKPIEERKSVLEQYRGQFQYADVAEVYEENLNELFHEVVAEGREGLILKKKESRYYEGSRSSQWQKLKKSDERDVKVVGYTRGEGSRSDHFGALVLSDGTQYVGKVGSGFGNNDLEEITDMMEEVSMDEAHLTYGEVGEDFVPVRDFVIQVKFQNITDSGKLRSPVFDRLRPNKDPDSVRPIS